jgi:hypothetical protein
MYNLVNICKYIYIFIFVMILDLFIFLHLQYENKYPKYDRHN